MSTPKFLVIDPDTGRQRTLRSILSSLGHRSGAVESVVDRIGAMDVLKKKRFQMAFVCDLPPKLPALEIVEEILSNPSSKRLPIVVCSSSPSPQAVQDAVKAGAKGFLGHPFSVSDVEDCLRQVLG